MRDYTKIKAWQKADELALVVYRATSAFPKHELYGLTGQIRRAALTELTYLLHLSHRLEYVSGALAAQLEPRVREVFACLHGLIVAVDREVQ
jgi:hypothetical protein